MSNTPVWIPSGEGRSDLTEKKSRFIGLLRPAESTEQIRLDLKALKEEHPQARHVVHAFILGDDGSRIGFSDDGEPHGTAGRPVFDALRGSGFSWAALYVIRYFGGIKLGTGGLVSAYSRCAADCATATPRREKIPMLELVLTLTYPQHQRLREALPGFEGEILNETYAERIGMEIRLPALNKDLLSEFVRELGRGSIPQEFRKSQ